MSLMINRLFDLSKLPFIFCMALTFLYPVFSSASESGSTPGDNLRTHHTRGGWGINMSLNQKISNRYFDSSWNKVGSSSGSFPFGSGQKYSETRFLFGITYSFLDDFEINFGVPIVSRKESHTYNSRKAGIGDASLGLDWLFAKKPSLHLQTEWKIPSGSSELSYDMTKSSPYTDLPLGTGQHDLYCGLKTTQAAGIFGFAESAGYKLRFRGRPSYLQNDFVTFNDSSSGTSSTYPLGNRTIDFGDAINAGFEIELKIHEQFSLSGKIAYIFQRQTTIHTAVVVSNDIESSEAFLPSAHFMKVTPQISFHPSDGLRCFVSIEIPLAGKNWPVLPIVDSLEGLSYGVGFELDY